MSKNSVEDIEKDIAPNEEMPEERPPFFSTWKSMYALVLGNLVLMIVVFYLITIALK